MGCGGNIDGDLRCQWRCWWRRCINTAPGIRKTLPALVSLKILPDTVIAAFIRQSTLAPCVPPRGLCGSGRSGTPLRSTMPLRPGSPS